MNTVRYTDPGFAKRLSALAAASSLFDPAIEQRTRAILDDVRARGDAALLFTSFVVYLHKQIDLQYPNLWIFVGNLAIFGVLLAILSRPRAVQNRRIAVPNSRYNPQLAQRAVPVEPA